MQRLIYKLDDKVIAQIVKLIQIGMLTQTDVVDHMRQLRLEPAAAGTGNLELTPEYIEKDQRDIDAMFDHLESLMSKEKLDA
jgi:hypothetical protein